MGFEGRDEGRVVCEVNDSANGAVEDDNDRGCEVGGCNSDCGEVARGA